MGAFIKCPYCIATEKIKDKPSKFILIHKNKNFAVCLNCQSTFSVEKIEINKIGKILR